MSQGPGISGEVLECVRKTLSQPDVQVKTDVAAYSGCKVIDGLYSDGSMD